jgi:hypothetical protein
MNHRLEYDYCIKHGHGAFIDTGEGIACIYCILDRSKQRKTAKGYGWLVIAVKKLLKENPEL